MVILGIGFLGMQFIRPELKNSFVTADLKVAPQAKEVLMKSCYDCHSNETRLSDAEPSCVRWKQSTRLSYRFGTLSGNVGLSMRTARLRSLTG
jgi:Haem-binding domain